MPEIVQVGPEGRVRVDRRGPLGAPGPLPPLVLIGGMTQTLASWGGQLRPLAEDRLVFAYEARGQGQTELPVEDVGPGVHVDDLARLLDALGLPGPVDVCGFSFGGRVALAFAAERPARVRRLVVTGVSAGRGALGRVIVRAWRAALATGDLECLAWLSLADTLGPAYLAAHERMLPAIVQAVVDRNRFAGIRALFDQTLGDDETSPWHPVALAPRLRCPTLLIAGEHDRLAPAADLAALAALVPGGVVHRVVPGVGHTVPIEAPEVWRRHVRTFLSSETGEVAA
jgi:3-oxoadipate enol-lactonase